MCVCVRECLDRFLALGFLSNQRSQRETLSGLGCSCFEYPCVCVSHNVMQGHVIGLGVLVVCGWRGCAVKGRCCEPPWQIDPRSLHHSPPLHTHRFLPFGLELLLPSFMFDIQAFNACVFACDRLCLCPVDTQDSQRHRHTHTRERERCPTTTFTQMSTFIRCLHITHFDIL